MRWGMTAETNADGEIERVLHKIGRHGDRVALREEAIVGQPYRVWHAASRPDPNGVSWNSYAQGPAIGELKCFWQ